MKLTKAGKIKLGSSFIAKGGHVCYRVLANNKHKSIVDFDGREMIASVCFTNNQPGWGSGYRCKKCKGKGYTELSGPSFSCALIIMDRRNV